MPVAKNTSAAVIFKEALEQFRQKLPFVIYSKPDSGKTIAIFQHDSSIYHVNDFNETGYIFAPFNGNKIILIPEDKSDIFVSDKEISVLKTKNTVVIEQNKDRIHHEKLVQKAINTINKGLLHKVVLSRKEIAAVADFDFTSVYQKLADHYPDAFTYCWFHPETGLWAGAFSEQLLKVKNNELFTMAVAGTQKWTDNAEIIWKQKEMQEQRFVTDFIVQNLKPYTTGIEISIPYTLKAGNLAHIKTVIKAILNDNTDLRKIIDALHPTPAVCGLPKEAAKDFILHNEGYDREYYSGFHGEFNKDSLSGDKQTDLFVNLRCMQVKTVPGSKMAKAHLYIGGGITKESHPESEWIETVNKSQTIKKILF